jgi:hypothetical protein
MFPLQNFVLLESQGIGLAGGRHAAQRLAQLADAARIGIRRIIRERLEHVAAQQFLPRAGAAGTPRHSPLLDHGDGWGTPAAPIASAVPGHTSQGHPAGNLTRDDVLDNITLYWLTRTAVSSPRLYWENKLGLYNAAGVSVPAAVSVDGAH